MPKATPEATEPLDLTRHSLPVRGVAVEIISGPQAGTQVQRPERVSLGTAESCDICLKDTTVSRFHCELRSAAGELKLVDTGSTNGVYVGALKVRDATLPEGTVFKVGRTELKVLGTSDATVELHGTHELEGIVGRSSAIRRAMALCERAAETDSPVLLQGESGTGKELFARAVHHLSGRRAAPFVVVDCGSLSQELVNSELFGHERGAFTGADRRREGAFERANGGTLFLDEIGELPQALQPNLLGVLERHTFRRLGGDQELKSDFRVVAATHRDLRAEINQNRFRLDLYYRLSVVRIEVPALRDRIEDLPLLVSHFLEQRKAAPPVRALFDAGRLAELKVASWPGNVRALRHYVDAAIALGELGALDEGSGPSTAKPAGDWPKLEELLQLDFGAARDQVMRAFERNYLSAILKRASGNVAEAARQSGINRTYLFDLLRRNRMSR